jgi:hypothetical protein
MIATALTVSLNALPIVLVAEETFLDPTQPNYVREAEVKKKAEFTVTAILHSGERQTAVINDQLVAKGDQVDGAEVIQIRPDAIELRYRGQSITRHLPTAVLRK